MNHNLPLPSHVLHGMWSRAGSLRRQRPRGSSLCLLLLALLTFLPQKASAALPSYKDWGWITDGIYTKEYAHRQTLEIFQACFQTVIKGNMTIK